MVQWSKWYTINIPICILYIPVGIQVVYYISRMTTVIKTPGPSSFPQSYKCRTMPRDSVSCLLLTRDTEFQHNVTLLWHYCDMSNIPNSTGFGISLTMYDISDANVTQWLVFSSSILWHLLCVKYTKLDRSWHRHIYIYHMHILKVEDTSLKVRKAKFWSKIRNFLCLVSAFASRSHICS